MSKKSQKRLIELSRRIFQSFAFDVNHHGLPRVKHADGSYHVVNGFYDDSIADNAGNKLCADIARAVVEHYQRKAVKPAAPKN